MGQELINKDFLENVAVVLDTPSQIKRFKGFVNECGLYIRYNYTGTEYPIYAKFIQTDIDTFIIWTRTMKGTPYAIIDSGYIPATLNEFFKIVEKNTGITPALIQQKKRQRNERA